MLKKIGRIVLVSCLYYGWHIPSAMAQADAMPISTVQFEGPGGNVGAFPITTGITKLVIGTDGVNLEFSKKEGPNRWPNTCGAPFADPADDCKEDGGRIDMGALQYSMGIVAKVNGQWVASAPIEMWYGRAPSGTGQIQNQEATCDTGSGQLHCNWYYDRNRWPGLFQARFTAGEQLGFFVVAGDARNNYVPLQERSNIVLFTLPATNVAATFEYAGGQSNPVNDALHRLRATYPARMTAAQFGQLLNDVALANPGFVLLGKASGNNCPSPRGPAISCDFLVNAATKRGWDVLSDAGDGGVGSVVDMSGDGADLSGALADGSRTLVEPTGGTAATCSDPKANNVGQPLPCTYDAPPDLTGRVVALESALAQARADIAALSAENGQIKAEAAAQRDALNSIDAAEHALGAKVDAIVSKPIPVSCRAVIKLGVTTIPISCSLGF